ncbi:NAD(P)-dependent oxidoreductase [Phenylobacterium sp. Root77]|uniref:dTDP-4-dehydrorhamnose reductase n=1 Tax=unclassified Phenylobacterium TaxID=2640670 RepID=UPI0006FDF3DD|nr:MULTISPECIES: dTDP-4-dehydrorhamnose reductase [unclassified Phenylobacterium]KQW70354.1 NAD(P)-dependent oxidoreductase [Phenylobacterium sp. Root1277]KQW91225.1 NAD(P)-dependent oxidoreductase [Phenylobacterium sp. Root1290]KRC39138.1 NAD(P)-dependent oxidoreductase [Phenylobacterium sp. Root77]
MTSAATTDVLLTGGSGQVGYEVMRQAPDGVNVVAPGRAELDLSDPDAIFAMVASRPWAAVINCAAYTAVDRAESEAVEAWRANALGPATLAQVTAAARIPLIHVSTDYVFDGSKNGFYKESDSVAPLGIYGASKEAGEQAVRTGNPRHVILRTAWVVSPHGTNFIKTMLRLAETRPEIRVVNDQRGCPTSAADIAAVLLRITARLVASPQTAPTGTYHFVNSGEATWFELAQAVFEMAAARGYPVPKVEAITTAEYPTPARRPANSRLDTAKLRSDYAINPRPWRAAVEDIVEALLPAKQEQGL